MTGRYEPSAPWCVHMVRRIVSGVRFDGPLWSAYKAQCRVESVRPNVLFEAVMSRVAESGSVKGFLESLSVVSELGEVAADKVLLKQRLQRLDHLVTLGYGAFYVWREHDPVNGPTADPPELAPTIQRLIDELLPVLRRVKDVPLLRQSEEVLDRALAYIKDCEEPSNPDEPYSSFTEQALDEAKKKDAEREKLAPTDGRS